MQSKLKFQVLINGVATQKFFIISTINKSYPMQALFEQFKKYADSKRAFQYIYDRSVIGHQIFILPNGDKMTVQQVPMLSKMV